MVVLLLAVLALFIWQPAGLLATAPPPPAAGGEFLRTYYPVPERVSLCGTELPLADPEVREDFDREFNIVLWSRVQTTMWLKRAARYFPPLEKRLRELRLPDDLKYVVLVESDLRVQARSPSGALGPWQFMKPTANRFFLKTEEKFDDRYDFLKATEAALQYLTFLYRTFKDWPLALAAYNCGEGRVQRAIQEQGVNDYFQLSLPEETERYVLRIAAAKVILSQPARYGYDLPPTELYPPLRYDEVEFTTDRDLPLRRLAEVCGTTYKKIRRLNPRLLTAVLPPGVYRLNVPAGSASRFYEAYLQGRLLAGLPASGQAAAAPLPPAGEAKSTPSQP